MPEETVEVKPPEPKLSDEQKAKIKEIATAGVALLESLDANDGSLRRFMSQFMGPRFEHTMWGILQTGVDLGVEDMPIPEQRKAPGEEEAVAA